MSSSQPPERGTLVTAALLVLGLTFAGYWIVFYVTPGDDPGALLPWFGIAAAAIVVLALLAYVLPRRKGDGR